LENLEDVVVINFGSWFVVSFAVTVCIGPVFANDKLSRQEAQFRAFLVRHGDPEKTLLREREFHQALLGRDLKSIRTQAKQFESELKEFKRNAEDLSRESPDTTYVMGSCHYASFALHEAMVLVDRQGLPRKLPEKIDEVVPLPTRERFVENMRRCELVRRRPHSERLIGAGLT
jgi:hypothetical protein